MKKIKTKLAIRLKNWITTLLGIAIICVAHYAYWFVGIQQIDWIGLTGITFVGVVLLYTKDEWLKILFTALINKFGGKE